MIKKFFLTGHPLAVSATIALVAMLAYQILPPIMSGNFLGQAGNSGGQCADYGTFTRYIVPGSVLGLVPGPSGEFSFLQYDERMSGPPTRRRFTTAGSLGAAIPVSIGDFRYDALNSPDGNMWGLSGTQYQQLAPDGTTAVFSAPETLQAIKSDVDGHLYLQSFSMTSQGWYTYTLYSLAPDGTKTALYTAPQHMLMGGVAGDAAGNTWTTLAPAAVYSGSKNGLVVKIGSSGISTWQLPTTERGLGIAIDAQGNAWVSAQANIFKVTPAGAITTYPIPWWHTPHTNTPAIDSIIRGTDGNMWALATEQIALTPTNRRGLYVELIKIAPDGTMSKYDVEPAPGFSFDPNHMPSFNVKPPIIGPDGNLWYSYRYSRFDDNNSYIVESAIVKVSLCGTSQSQTTSTCIGPATVTRHIVGTAPNQFGQVVPVVEGSDGNVWFTKENTLKISKLTVPGDVVMDYAIPWGNPVNRPLVKGSDGNIWFSTVDVAGALTSKITRVTPSGSVVQFDTPAFANGPMVAGPDGNIWFSENAQGMAKIAKITPAGTITEYPTSLFAVIQGLAKGSDGSIWFTPSGNGAGWIGKMTTVGVVTQYTLPASVSTNDSIITNTIVSGPDGNIWFTVSKITGNKIGKITPAGDVTLTDSPIAGSLLIGPDAAVWTVRGTNIGRVASDGSVTQFSMPATMGNVVASESFVSGPNQSFWLGGTEILSFGICALGAPVVQSGGSSQAGGGLGSSASGRGSCVVQIPVSNSAISKTCSPQTSVGVACDPPQVYQITTSEQSTLELTYTAAAGHCTPVRVHVRVDGGPEVVSPYVNANGASVLGLGSFPAGNHAVEVRGSASQDCGGGSQPLATWGGAATIRVIPIQCSSSSARAASSSLRAGPTQSSSQPSVNRNGTGPVCPPCRQACGVSGPSCITCGAGTVPTCPAGSIGAPYCDINNKPRCMFAGGGVTSATCGAATQAPPLSCAQCTATYCGASDVCVVGSSSSRAGDSSSSMSSSSLRSGPGCGDGIVQPPEECDAGTGGSATCDAACRAIACANSNECATNLCQNGTCRCDATHSCPTGEQCDLATGQCVLPRCSDGIVQLPEQCDGGTGGSATCDTGCRAIACEDNSECPTGLCLNGACRCDADNPCPQGEQCDSGTGQCVVPRCGDGLKEISEACDDGNMADNDGCSFQCQIECDSGDQCDSGICQEGVCQPVCGDGIKETTESCDDGNVQDGDGCSFQCQIECDSGDQCDSGICQAGVCSPICGDNIRETTEPCDDGNTRSGDGCSAQCFLECTDDSECPTGLCINDICSVTFCGNGVTDAGEACDDGNGADSDSCSNACRLGLYQSCIVMNQCESNLCRQGQCSPCNTTADCGAGLLCLGRMCASAPACGNGKHEFGETCDDGDLDDSDVCSNTCQNGNGLACEADYDCVSERCVSGTCTACARADQCASNECTNGRCAPACGNGEIDRGEQCDAGAQNSDVLSDQCRKNCLRPQCGDGVQDAGEQCDDGNADDTDGCTRACRAVQVQSIMGSGGSGSPCADSTQCASGACQSGACKGMPAGTSCITGAQCVSGSCDSGACSPTDAQVANLTGGHAPAGETGPGAVAVMGAGAAAGWAWMRRKGYKGFRR